PSQPLAAAFSLSDLFHGIKSCNVSPDKCSVLVAGDRGSVLPAPAVCVAGNIRAGQTRGPLSREASPGGSPDLRGSDRYWAGRALCRSEERRVGKECRS